MAILASQGVELAARLARAKAAVARSDTLNDLDGGVFVGRPGTCPRLGFLFPGQGAPCRLDGGAWRRRFANLAGLMDGLATADGGATNSTELVQPAVVAASLGALEVLKGAGISASVATGHSLGEITSLAWAEALDPPAALQLASQRGSIMARAGTPGGAMLRVSLAPDEAEHLAQEVGAVVACRNGPAETVLSGSAEVISLTAERCRSRGVDASKLAVSHAFHSRDMKPARDPLARVLAATSFRPIRHNVISTVTGSQLSSRTDPRQLLADQLVAPVLFDTALDLIAAQSDILVEVGPGHGLTRLVRACGIAAFSIDAFSDSLRPLLSTLAALFTAGVDVQARNLFSDRHLRGFDPDAVPYFIESPCGSHDETTDTTAPLAIESDPDVSATEPQPEGGDSLSIVQSTIARETGLPLSEIGPDDRFLDALHLNSLAARALQVGLPSAPTEFANATPRQLADALAEMRTFRANDLAQHRIAGVRPWVRTYAMTWANSPNSLDGENQIRWLQLTVDQQLPPSFAPDENSGLAISIDQPLTLTTAELLVALVAQAAKAGMKHLALCHKGAPVSAFLRSVAQESRLRERWCWPVAARHGPVSPCRRIPGNTLRQRWSDRRTGLPAGRANSVKARDHHVRRCRCRRRRRKRHRGRMCAADRAQRGRDYSGGPKPCR